MPKISAKFDQDHPLQKRQMQVGSVKIDDFPQITGYISKTAQFRGDLWIKKLESLGYRVVLFV